MPSTLQRSHTLRHDCAAVADRNATVNVRFLFTTLLVAILLSTAVAFLVASPVWADDPESKYDPEADFDSYKTFAWRLQEVRYPPAGTPADLEILTVITETLGEEGWHEVRGEGAKPDLWVTYYAVVEDQLVVHGSDYELGSWMVWSETEDQQVRSYKEGTLVIDIIDATSNKLVWSGWVSDVAIDNRSMRNKVPRAVRRILKQFPPDVD